MTPSLAATHVRAIIADLLRDIWNVEAAALYGSVARGDVEPHSDIDLLLLCQAGQKRALMEMLEPSLSREFPKLSLNLYSRHELTFLNRSSSLFLLHLKREADILLDRSGFITELLSNFRPKASYRADFLDSLTLLDPVKTRIEGSPNDLHRLSYVYSLFRVFGVYLLAAKGIFEFSKSRMADYLSREYPHARHAIAMLSQLRVLNASFFCGGPQGHAPEWLAVKNSFSPYAAALAELIDNPMPVLERSYGDGLREFVIAAAPFRRLNYRLRTWFLLLAYDGINLHCQRNGVAPMVSFQRQCIESMLSKPLPSSVANTARQVLDHVRDYRLKYFLSEGAKIKTESAIAGLQALAGEIR